MISPVLHQVSVTSLYLQVSSRPCAGLSFDLSPCVGPSHKELSLSKRRIFGPWTATRSDFQTKSDVGPHRPQVTHAKTG